MANANEIPLEFKQVRNVYDKLKLAAPHHEKAADLLLRFESVSQLIFRHFFTKFGLMGRSMTATVWQSIHIDQEVEPDWKAKCDKDMDFEKTTPRKQITAKIIFVVSNKH